MCPSGGFRITGEYLPSKTQHSNFFFVQGLIKQNAPIAGKEGMLGII